MKNKGILLFGLAALSFFTLTAFDGMSDEEKINAKFEQMKADYLSEQAAECKKQALKEAMKLWEEEQGPSMPMDEEEMM